MKRLLLALLLCVGCGATAPRSVQPMFLGSIEPPAAQGVGRQTPTAGFLDFLIQGAKEKTKLARPVLNEGERWIPVFRMEDEISDETADDFKDFLKQADDLGADGVLVSIASPGGSVPAGMSIIREMEDTDLELGCVVDGDAASMAFAILQSCGERMMTPRSTLMMHEPAVGGMFSGHANDWQAGANMLDASTKALSYQYAHHLKVSQAEVERRIEGGRQWWLERDEAKKIGAVDRMVKNLKSVTEAWKHGRKPPAP